MTWVLVWCGLVGVLAVVGWLLGGNPERLKGEPPQKPFGEV